MKGVIRFLCAIGLHDWSEWQNLATPGMFYDYEQRRCFDCSKVQTRVTHWEDL